MPKQTYRAVPGDEENSRSSSDTIYEKDNAAIRLRDDRFERDVRTRALDFLNKNWAWIAHTLLLSLSLILFTLSFCQRTATARISDLQVTEQYSSWCMSINFPSCLFRASFQSLTETIQHRWPLS